MGKDWTKRLTACRIDSISASGADSLYHNYPVLVPHPEEEDCYVLGNGWTGKMIHLANGDFGFENYQQDTLFIKPLAIPGESWTILHLPNLSQIEARVQVVKDTVLFGIPDSVKIIQLTHLNSLGQVVNDSINLAQLHLGKETGLISAFRFFEYPASLLL